MKLTRQVFGSIQSNGEFGGCVQCSYVINSESWTEDILGREEGGREGGRDGAGKGGEGGRDGAGKRERE